MPDHALYLVSSREPTGLAEDSGETPTSADQALEVIKGMLGEALVSPPVLLELAYYAADPDLLALMRVLAVLDPQQRAQVLAYAQAMRAEAGPAAL